MQKIKAIAFDFDGTVADTVRLIFKSINKLSKEMKHKKVRDIHGLRDISTDAFLKEEIKVSLFKFPRLLKQTRLFMKKHMDKVKLFRGIKTVLNEICTNCKIFIVTANSEDVVKYIIDKEKVKSIEKIYGDFSFFGKHKALEEIMNAYQITNDEMVFIGDEIRDIEASKRMGVKIISATRGFNTEEALLDYNPDFIAQKPKEILKILKSNFSCASHQ